MVKYKKIAFIFPGQGAQYVGMGKDFIETFPTARQTFEEADEILGRNLSKIVIEGPEQLLTETKNSQTGIFVTSLAMLKVLRELFPQLVPTYTAGLSLGEYTALQASNRLSVSTGLQVVQKRGQYMNDACEATRGTMAVVLGMSGEDVQSVVKDVNLPNELWIANYNCPGQVVISGTIKGIESGTQALQAKGAKRVLPLQVHGAFHSGLMLTAEQKLAPHIEEMTIKESPVKLVMNVVGDTVDDIRSIKNNLIKQVTHSVRWEQGIRHMMDAGVDLFIEIGCGKTLSGFNKRIGVLAPTWTLEKIEDLKTIEGSLS
jgi:[acyl-carrier-protein] S-malonyltransferase